MRLRLPRSLRGRVLVSTLVLVAVGLIVAGAATYGFLNSFLERRVDQQLQSAVFPVADALNETDRFDPDRHGPPRAGFLVPPGTYGVLLDADGRTIRAEPFGFEEQQAPAPDLPSGLPGSTSEPDAGPRLLTVSTAEGSTIRYRAIAVPLAEGGTLVVAIPLTEVTDTLRRLLTVEIAVSVAVVAVIGGVALWLVRIGLRPLQRMGDTAGAIAAGDLSRRVTPAEPDTEVGRLGLALNAMLGQIEEAFAERTASEQRLRRFVADASHELRTPLTSIRGYAELFRRGASGRPEDLSKSMERIEAEAARMGVLVEDLLLLARLDQGLPLARERVELATLVARAVQDARAADPGRRIELRGDGPVFVEGDEVRLKQVLDNLLANARRHTPPGTRANVTVASDGEATVDVADDGPGIPMSVGARIFERFYRVDSSRSRQKGGAGLGLAIASEIAHAHGGSLALVPSDRGARFRLTLPVARPRDS